MEAVKHLGMKKRAKKRIEEGEDLLDKENILKERDETTRKEYTEEANKKERPGETEKKESTDEAMKKENPKPKFLYQK